MIQSSDRFFLSARDAERIRGGIITGELNPETRIENQISIKSKHSTHQDVKSARQRFRNTKSTLMMERRKERKAKGIPKRNLRRTCLKSTTPPPECPSALTLTPENSTGENIVPLKTRNWTPNFGKTHTSDSSIILHFLRLWVDLGEIFRIVVGVIKVFTEYNEIGSVSKVNERLSFERGKMDNTHKESVSILQSVSFAN